MINQKLSALLLKQRGDNRLLLKEVLELSKDSKLRLIRILEDLEQQASSERRKRRRGQIF